MVVLTIEILFNITEVTSLWVVDERMSMLHSILRGENNMGEDHA